MKSLQINFAKSLIKNSKELDSSILQKEMLKNKSLFNSNDNLDAIQYIAKRELVDESILTRNHFKGRYEFKA
jgi:hypothetical protein